MEDKEKVTELREETLDNVSGGTGSSNGKAKYWEGEYVIYFRPPNHEHDFGVIAEVHDWDDPITYLVRPAFHQGSLQNVKESDIEGQMPRPR